MGLGREAGEGVGQLLLADALRLLLEAGDQRLGAQGAEPGAEVVELLLDDLLGARHLVPAALEVALDQQVERVDGVQEDVLHLAGGRLDVAGHAEVHHQQRPGAAGAHRRGDVLAGEHGLVGAGGDHHQVGPARLVLTAVEGDQLGAGEFLLELRGPLGAPVGHHQLAGAPLDQRPGHRMSDLAGAHHQHPARLQAAEDLPRQLHDGVADRHRAGGDRRLLAGPPAGRGGAAQQPLEHRPLGPDRLGEDRRLLDLPQDLGLAEHHGFQAARHRHQVTGRLAVAFHVQPAGPLELRRAGEEDHVQGGLVGAVLVTRLEIKLGAVAGREQEGLGHLGAGEQMHERLLGLLFGERDPLAQLQRRAAEVRADQEQRRVRRGGAPRIVRHRLARGTRGNP